MVISGDEEAPNAHWLLALLLLSDKRHDPHICNGTRVEDEVTMESLNYDTIMISCGSLGSKK